MYDPNNFVHTVRSDSDTVLEFVCEMTDGVLVINGCEYQDDPDDPTYTLVRACYKAALAYGADS